MPAKRLGEQANPCVCWQRNERQRRSTSRTRRDPPLYADGFLLHGHPHPAFGGSQVTQRARARRPEPPRARSVPPAASPRRKFARVYVYSFNYPLPAPPPAPLVSTCLYPSRIPPFAIFSPLFATRPLPRPRVPILPLSLARAFVLARALVLSLSLSSPPSLHLSFFLSLSFSLPLRFFSLSRALRLLAETNVSIFSSPDYVRGNALRYSVRCKNYTEKCP